MELLLPLLACSLLFPATTAAKDACNSQANDFQHLNSTGLHLTLHHPRSPCSPAPLPSDLPFSAIIASDAARMARFTASPTSLHRDNNLSDSLAATAPLSSAVPFGVANYVTQLGLGTPATLYTMVVDTGSSFTWLQCSPCMVSCHRQTGPLYDPQASSSYASVPCSAPQCDDLPATTGFPSRCSSSNGCVYHVSYGDGSNSTGYLIKDTVSFGSSSFPGFYYGCGQDNEGLFGSTSGLIGLGKNKLSLFYQLAPALGSSFSYCLPTLRSSSAGYLSIGPYNPGQYSYTPMVSGSSGDSFYYVSITGISVGGSPLAVSPSEYSRMPTVIDSGSTLAQLPTAVYSALSKAVVAAMEGTPRASDTHLDTCFQGQASTLSVPAVDLTFAGGVTLKLAAMNVMYDVDRTKTCLAFSASDRIAIIGNTQQQTFSIVYDVTRSRIGFAAGGCR
ncbi:unnamed protein product [Alopecurus aequalis]